MKVLSPKFSLFPLAWLSIFFAGGIAVAASTAIPVGFLAAACVTCALSAILFGRGRVSGAFVCAAFFLAGSLCLDAAHAPSAEPRVRDLYDANVLVSGEPVVLEGILSREPEPAAGGFAFQLDARTIQSGSKPIPVSGKVRLFAPAATPEALADHQRLDIGYGSVIRVAVPLIREDAYQNPGVVSRKDILDQQGIDATGSVKSLLLIEHIDDENVFLPLGWAYQFRADLINTFAENFDPATAGVLNASLLGNRYFLDRSTANLFREGGTFHILVISGLHITFIGAALVLLVGILTRDRFSRFFIPMIFLWAFTMSVGAEVPVVRAAVMFTMLAFSRIVNRRGTLLNTLGACALLLLVWRPDDLFTASFQLTFASVAALVIMAFPLIEYLRTIGKWSPSTETPFPARVPGWLTSLCETIYWQERVWHIERSRQNWSANLLKSPFTPWAQKLNANKLLAYLFEGVLASAIVQLWLLPFLVIYFHRVGLGSIILNLWAGAFVAAETVLALFAVVALKISAVLAGPLIAVVEFADRLQMSVSSLVVRTNISSFRLPSYTGWGRAIYAFYFCLVLLLTYCVFRWRPFDYTRGSIARQNRLKHFASVLSGIITIALAVILFHPFSTPRPDGRLHVDFLDVGQGDSALVTFPNGETMLIDGGGQRRFDIGDDDRDFEPDSPRIGEAVTSAYLWAKGYSRIDYLVATHADADHIQGLTDVANNFAVRFALVGRSPNDDPDFDEFASALGRTHVPLKIISRGDELEIGGVQVQILFPEADETYAAISDNDHSVVIRLVLGKRKILMTGDIERSAEMNILAEQAVDADVVKVPHHGSRTSSTDQFVSAVHPSLAVISVGKRSVFGHPHPEVVERWRNSGSAVLTTGRSGTISVSTDGSDLVWERFVDERK